MRLRIRIRIQLVTLMRIRIHLIPLMMLWILPFILMRIWIHNNDLSLSSLSAIGTGCGLLAQSNELTRGPPNLICTFVYRGSSHRRKSAACPNCDMVWLHHSPIPVERRGLKNFLVQMISICLATRRGRGEGIDTLWLLGDGGWS
jgi:hypothetical protein